VSRGEITAPTLVLEGKEDILLPVKLSEELAALPRILTMS